jgi:sterol desaturase/sphingolipid hydroxylase (fatty acid hydroxylase superfamily)
MAFFETLARSLKGMFPGVLLWVVAPLLPFIIAEQARPLGPRPRWCDYALNIVISLSTSLLTVPVGIAAGLCSARLHPLLSWKPWSAFHSLGHVPVVGAGFEMVATVLLSVFLHDLWFYWAHRLQHKVPFLWEVHKIHHSDERMNCSTFARDHFLQAAWTRFFPIFTLGLLFDLDPRAAGTAAFYTNAFLVLWTMFSHSAIRVRLPWLDRVLVTPQVHRIHHSRDRAHFDTNFADALPVFDILFGTYRRPRRDEFPATGVAGFPAPRSPWAAQLGPLRDMGVMLRPRPRRASL